MTSWSKNYRPDSPSETAICTQDRGLSTLRFSKVGEGPPGAADGCLRQDQPVKVLRDLRSGTQQALYPTESGFASLARGRNDRRTGAGTEVDV